MDKYITYTVDLEDIIRYYEWKSKTIGSNSFVMGVSDIITYTELDVLLVIF